MNVKITALLNVYYDFDQNFHCIKYLKVNKTIALFAYWRESAMKKKIKNWLVF